MNKKVILGAVIIILIIGGVVLFTGESPEGEVISEDEEQVEESVTDIIHRALNEGNSTICEEIDDPGRRKGCYNEFVVKEARVEDDPVVCEQIEDEVGVTSCKERVYVYRAIAEKDKSWCDKVEDKQRKSQCLELVSNRVDNKKDEE